MPFCPFATQTTIYSRKVHFAFLPSLFGVTSCICLYIAEKCEGIFFALILLIFALACSINTKKRHFCRLLYYNPVA